MEFDIKKTIENGVKQAFAMYELNMGMTLEEAVEKQIPKKPVYPCTSPVCPACDSFVNENKKYCPDCGQALDWKGVEVNAQYYGF